MPGRSTHVFYAQPDDRAAMEGAACQIDQFCANLATTLKKAVADGVAVVLDTRPDYRRVPGEYMNDRVPTGGGQFIITVPPYSLDTSYMDAFMVEADDKRRLDALIRAAVPFARVARVLGALPPTYTVADDMPLRQATTGNWPTVGDCRRLNVLMPAEFPE